MSSRAIAVVALLSVFAPKMPEQCNKLMGKAAPPASAEPPPPPPPPPPLSATAPPIYTPPEMTPTPTVGTATPAKPTPSELESQAAKAAMEKKNYKQVRTILDKKLKAGTATPDDLIMLRDACERLKDNKCLLAVQKVAPSE